MRQLAEMIASACICILAAGTVLASPLDEALATYQAADFSKAVTMLRPLAEAGNARAQAALYRIYWYGKGTHIDRAEALKWARRAASLGNADGEYGLAIAYAFGLGVPKDADEGLRWLQKSTADGSRDAEAWLGRRYLYGEGVPTDTERGLWYLRMAADNGLGRALVALASIRGNGMFGQPKDAGVALRLLRRAAELRYFPAQLNLSMIFADSDPTQAAMWDILAATTGCSKGGKVDRLMFPKGATPSDIEKATALAKRWDERHPPVDIDQFDQAFHICLAALSPRAVAYGNQEPRKPVKQDTTGKGAVLCIWSLYVELEKTVDVCELPFTPTDRAMRTAISRIDRFIIANSTTPVSQEDLDSRKQAESNKLVMPFVQPLANGFLGGEGACTAEFLTRFREVTPERIRKSVDELLSIPREPLMNPCL